MRHQRTIVAVLLGTAIWIIILQLFSATSNKYDFVSNNEVNSVMLASNNRIQHLEQKVRELEEIQFKIANEETSEVKQQLTVATTTKHPLPPHRMSFVYTHNILETKQPLLLYKNVQRTIRMYRQLWRHSGEPEIAFSTFDDCEDIIRRVRPNLLKPFQTEKQGALRSDICRAVDLYEHGGYYFDNDMAVVEPFDAEDVYLDSGGDDRKLTFVAVTAWFKKIHQNTFMVALKHDPIMHRVLDLMEAWYRGEFPNKRASLVGPASLFEAHRQFLEFQKNGTAYTDLRVYLLSERVITNIRKGTTNERIYPHIVWPQGSKSCKYAVHDRRREVVHFYTRVPGGGRSCKPQNATV